MANEVNITITGLNLSKPAFREAMADIAKLKAAASDLKDDINIGVKFDNGDLTSELIALKSKMQALGIADIADIDVQPGRITTQLQLLKRLISQAGITDILDLNINKSDLASKLGDIAKLTETIPVNFKVGDLPKLPQLGTTESLNFNTGGLADAQKEFAALGLSMEEVQKKISEVDAAIAIMNGDMMKSALAAVDARDNFMKWTVGLANASAAMSILDGSLMQQALYQRTAGIALAESAADTATLRNSIGDLTASMSQNNDVVRTAIPLFIRAGGGWTYMQSHIQLFGGALASSLPMWASAISLWHLAGESVIELAGTLIPAALGLVAFGAAAVPTVKDLYQQMSSLYTVTQAYGTSIYPLTGKFQQMAQAVQPEVYVLFGEALTVANSKGDLVQQMAVAAGKAMDDLGARFTYAITQSSTFSTIMSHAANDLAGWGNLMGNIGGIIGNVLKVLPGYAEVLLQALNDVTHALEVITASGAGQAILGIGLAFHGAYIWIGLLATAATFLVRGALSLIPRIALAAAGALDGLGAAGAVASTGILAVGAASEEAATLPWGWILTAAAGLVVFAIAMGRAKDSVENFFAGLEAGIQKASINNLMTTINAALVSGQQELTKTIDNTTQALGAYQKAQQQGAMMVNLHTGAVSRQMDVLQGAVQQQDEAQAGMNSLNDTYRLVTDRVSALSKEYGGNASALALLNGAGITTAQITSNNAQTWGEALIEIQAYNNAMAATTQSAGRLGAAQNALNFQAGDTANALGQTASAMANVVQAEDALMNNVLGGETAFNTYATAINQSKLALSPTNGLAAAAAVAGASIDGLNNQSLNLSQTFYGSAIPAAQKLIDALQSENISTSDLTTVIATQASQMLQYAGSSDAAKAAIVAMINNALGPGTVSLQDLNKWVSTNSTTMAGLKAIIDRTEISASALAGVLQSDLNAQFASDILQSSGAKAAMQNFTDAITHGGTSTAAYHGARAQLIADLENAGMSAKDATNYVDGLQRQIDSLKGKNVQVTMNGQGSYSIQGYGLPGHPQPNFAAGGPITMGTGPTADDVPVMASKGEYVVQASSVSKYGVGMMDQINAGSFAGGGLIGGNLSAGYIQGMYDTFVSVFESAFIATMQAAMAASEQQALAAAQASNPKQQYKVYDSGGWLNPGWNPPMYNGTGRPERLNRDYSSGTGGTQLQVDSGGSTAFEMFMVEAIRKWVRIKGAGNVQKAFGKE